MWPLCFTPKSYLLLPAYDTADEKDCDVFFQCLGPDKSLILLHETSHRNSPEENAGLITVVIVIEGITLTNTEKLALPLLDGPQ